MAQTLAAVDPAAVDDAALLDLYEELDVLVNQVRAVQARCLTAIHDRDAAAEWCGRSTRSWLIEDLRLAPGDAGRRMLITRMLEQLPATTAALETGRISAEHAHVI